MGTRTCTSPVWESTSESMMPENGTVACASWSPGSPLLVVLVASLEKSVKKATYLRTAFITSPRSWRDMSAATQSK